jgi:hypothetical protein
MSIKVLHLVSSSSLYEADEFVLGLLSAAGEHRQDAALCCLVSHSEEEPPLLGEALRLGFKAGVFVYPAPLSRSRNRDLREKVLRAGAGVLHTHDYKSTIIAALAFEPREVVRIASCLGLELDDLRSRLLGWLHLLALRRFDRVLAIPSELMPWLGRRLAREKGKVEIVPLDVDPNTFALRACKAYEELADNLERRRLRESAPPLRTGTR